METESREVSLSGEGEVLIVGDGDTLGCDSGTTEGDGLMSEFWDGADEELISSLISDEGASVCGKAGRDGCSTLNRCVDGVESIFPAMSTALTANTCSP